MRIILLIFFLIISVASFSQENLQYHTGPRGGCYYINKNGNKTYVDHSFCNRKSGAVASKAVNVETDSTNKVAPSLLKATQTKQRTYYKGPRGGCYYISKSGNKVYVERSVCD